MVGPSHKLLAQLFQIASVSLVLGIDQVTGPGQAVGLQGSRMTIQYAPLKVTEKALGIGVQAAICQPIDQLQRAIIQDVLTEVLHISQEDGGSLVPLC